MKKVDSTDIILKNKPRGVYNKKIFFTQKKEYALDLYIIYDFSIRFIYILAGWSNSQYNAQIYTFINFYRYSENYFAPGEYLLGNIAYTNSSHLILSYKSLFTNEKRN